MKTQRLKSKPLLSVLIPAHNEGKSLPATLKKIADVLDKAAILLEIIVVNDHSKDKTTEIINKLSKEDPRIKLGKNVYLKGYVYAVRSGLEAFTGDAVVIVMADSSDDPQDIIKYYNLIRRGYERAFGTRFCRKAKVTDYPMHKLILNRLGNLFIELLFWVNYNDMSNTFKC